MIQTVGTLRMVDCLLFPVLELSHEKKLISLTQINFFKNSDDGEHLR